LNKFLKYIRRTEKLSFKEIYRNEVLEDEETDPKQYFDADEVTNDLLEEKCFSMNYFEKYYVVAFAIDKYVFEAKSKDSGKKLE
jgi:hypothetical protein